jgi:hypothetical protein
MAVFTLRRGDPMCIERRKTQKTDSEIWIIRSYMDACSDVLASGARETSFNHICIGEDARQQRCASY